MKKLLFTTLCLTSSILVHSPHAHTNPLPTIPRIAQLDPDEGKLTPQQVQSTAKNISVRITAANNGGSGVIIAQKGSNYLVLTNAHVVRRATQLEIQAPDGQKYQAKSINGGFSAKYDLALLQFSSKAKYSLANLSSISGSPIDPPREIYSAGFPFDSKELRITSGEVSQLTDIPFDDGTQIGYKIAKGKKGIRQGMSGGAIFDSQGYFLGINTVGATPILPDYTYNDGSKPLAKLAARYREANWGIPVYNFLTNVKADILYGYDNLPKVEHQVTPTGYLAQLNTKARQMTVRIENSGGNGSGVIVAQEGSTYYVLTAKHVVQDEEKNTRQRFTNPQIITYDQDRHPVTSTVVAEGVDLAVVKFTSNNNYPIAQLGQHSTKDNDLAFVGGFPGRSNINSPLWQWQLNPGFIFSPERSQLNTQSSASFTNGYDLIYSSISYGGMSGGPVFDTAGNVIGIHGRTESTDLNSLGLSIQTFTGLATKLQVAPSLLKIVTARPVELNPTDRTNVIATMQNISPPQPTDAGSRWLAYANQLTRTRQYDKSVAAFDRTIAQGEVFAGNYGKAVALTRAKKFDLAAIAIAQAVAQVPNDKPRTNYAYVWNMQSIILRGLGKYDAALQSIEIAIDSDRSDLILRHEKATILMAQENYTAAIAIENQLIATKPKWFFYALRSFSKSKLGDERGALEDGNMAIQLNPAFEDAYVFRADAKSKLGDTQGAMADIAQALKLNPNNDFAYFHRAIIKSNTGDLKGATIDIDRAIELKPDNANNYSQRAIFKSSLGDNRGALEDVERAIKIDSFFFAHYKQRGDYKSYLGDEKAAIVDYDKAIELNPKYQPAYISRGQSKSKLGDNEGAILDIEQAIKLNPNSGYVYYVRAGIKSKTGDNKGAIEDYTKAIELNPKDYAYYISRSSSKLSMGDSKGAIEDCDRAIKLNPKSDSAYFIRAGIKSKIGDKKGAIEDSTKAIELNPKSIVNYAMRGAYKSSAGDSKGAIDDFDLALRIDPNNTLSSNIYSLRGGSKLALGDNSGALLDLNKSIELNPKTADTYFVRGYVKYLLGDNSSAIIDTEKAISINPKSAVAHNNRGLFKILMDRDREALPDLERAIELNPKQGESYACRGFIKETSGDKQGAIVDYQQAVKLDPKLMTDWKKQAESLRASNPASYQKLQQMIEKLEIGSK